MKVESWETVQNLNLSSALDSECIKVEGLGYNTVYLVVNPQQIMRDRVEALCGLIDTSRGYSKIVKTMEEVTVRSV